MSLFTTTASSEAEVEVVLLQAPSLVRHTGAAATQVLPTGAAATQVLLPHRCCRRRHLLCQHRHTSASRRTAALLSHVDAEVSARSIRQRQCAINHGAVRCVVPCLELVGPPLQQAVVLEELKHVGRTSRDDDKVVLDVFAHCLTSGVWVQHAQPAAALQHDVVLRAVVKVPRAPHARFGEVHVEQGALCHLEAVNRSTRVRILGTLARLQLGDIHARGWRLRHVAPCQHGRVARFRGDSPHEAQVLLDHDRQLLLVSPLPAQP
mmetsp:Transcript_38034/g.112592  ORF Transcript_38034/g.112592 Transcript_38034/m.112592 type:complete len:264 (-) Transcript_38034:311-1102(-)